MTNIKLIAFGCVPFLLGWAMDYATRLSSYTNSLPMLLICVLTLTIWAAVAFLFSKNGTPMYKVILLMNRIGFIDLMLLGTQELIIGHYLLNEIGIWSQYFYMPVMMPMVILLWLGSIPLFAIYCACFFSLVIASFAGCKCYEKSAIQMKR